MNSKHKKYGNNYKRRIIIKLLNVSEQRKHSQESDTKAHLIQRNKTNTTAGFLSSGRFGGNSFKY